MCSANLRCFKVKGSGEHRIEALRLAEIFRANVVDSTLESLVFEMSRHGRKKVVPLPNECKPLGLDRVAAHRDCGPFRAASEGYLTHAKAAPDLGLGLCGRGSGLRDRDQVRTQKV